MSAGKYKHLVSIQQLAAGQDALGQPVQTWSEVCAPWADMLNQNGASAVRSGADVSTTKTSIRIRWRTTAITAGMRVVCGSVIYDMYDEFGITKKTITFSLGTATTPRRRCTICSPRRH